MKFNSRILVRAVGKKEISISAGLDVRKGRPTQVMLVEGMGGNKAERPGAERSGPIHIV